MEDSREDRDNEVTASHDESTRDQNRFTACVIDPDDSRNGSEEHAMQTLDTDIKDDRKAYTIPTTPVASRDTVFPVRPRELKMEGA